jgi:hypothetical protein
MAEIHHRRCFPAKESGPYPSSIQVLTIGERHA